LLGTFPFLVISFSGVRCYAPFFVLSFLYLFLF
jgi:hypothetical protein